MSIVPLLLLCSLALVVASIVLFVFSAKQGDCHESDRLCLMPLEDDAATRREPDRPVACADPARPGSGNPPSSSPETD